MRLPALLEEVSYNDGNVSGITHWPCVQVVVVVLGWLGQFRCCVSPRRYGSLLGDFKPIGVESMQGQGYNVVTFAATLQTRVLSVRQVYQRLDIKQSSIYIRTGTRALGRYLLLMLERTWGLDSMNSMSAGEGLPRSQRSDWSVSQSSVHPDDCCLLSLPYLFVSLGTRESES